MRNWSTRFGGVRSEQGGQTMPKRATSGIISIGGSPLPNFLATFAFIFGVGDAIIIPVLLAARDVTWSWTLLLWPSVPIAVLSAAFAWMTSFQVALDVTATGDGITVVELTLSGRRRTKQVNWVELRGIGSSRASMGTVAVMTQDPYRSILLTNRQARAILTHPSCPISSLPDWLLRRIGSRQTPADR